MMNREEKGIVALTGCAHALSHGFLLIYPAVLILLQKEFAMDYLKLGIVGNMMNFCYGLGALPGGMIYNHLGPRRLFLLCFLGSSSAAVLISFSSGVTLFAGGLALLGFFGSLYHPLGNAVISTNVREVGRAMGIHGSVGNMGLSSAPFVIGLIASHWGWRQAYLFFAVLGVAIAVWSLFIPLAVNREKIRNASAPALSLHRNLRAYFTPSLILLYLINAMINFSFIGSLTFLPVCLAQRTSFDLFSMDQVAIGGMLSAIVLFMGVFGQFVGGLLAQRLHIERRLVALNVLSLPFVLAMSFAANSLLLLLGLIFFFLNFFLQPMANTLLARYTSEGMRGTAFGIYFLFAFGVGSSASSFTGWIAQRFGLQWVFLGIGGSVLMMIVFSALLLKVKPMGGLQEREV